MAGDAIGSMMDREELALFLVFSAPPRLCGLFPLILKTQNSM